MWMLQCKLDIPVYVNEEQVSFRLNQNKYYPSVGQDVRAAGFGTLYSSGPQPTYIRDVTVQVDSNSECAQAPDPLYNGNTISREILCACKCIANWNQFSKYKNVVRFLYCLLYWIWSTKGSCIFALMRNKNIVISDSGDHIHSSQWGGKGCLPRRFWRPSCPERNDRW